MLSTVAPGFHMWATFAFIVVLIALYVGERLSIEVSSAVCLAAIITLFHLFPLAGSDGENLLDAPTLLAGFGNPALVTVLSLIVVGQADVAGTDGPS